MATLQPGLSPPSCHRGPWGPQGAPPAKKMKKAVLFFEVEILDARTREKLCFLDKVEPHATIAEIKSLFTKAHPQWYPARQSLRLDPKGRSLKDEDVLQSLPVGTTATFYFRDLGAQISWVTVFLTEYAGPLLIYLVSPTPPASPQNCTYYWGFAAWMAYYINHPLYTPPATHCTPPLVHVTVTVPVTFPLPCHTNHPLYTPS
ncbi:PREDICTED: very-long-chain enoyl-CoA reductase-like, partial [Charadrius vociferus]|uniref:very-long-chain enoyl-CoA reductase-like n=1 Tax=Charadrius vociferus TaxID=50402 RepID=UPI000521224D